MTTPLSAPHGLNQAELFYSWRVQGVRQVVDVGGQLVDLFQSFVHRRPAFSRHNGNVCPESFAVNRRQCNSLTDVVVKVSPDPSTLPLFCFNQPAVHAREGLLLHLAESAQPLFGTYRLLMHWTHASPPIAAR